MKRKRILALALAFVLTLTLLPPFGDGAARAAGETEPAGEAETVITQDAEKRQGALSVTLNLEASPTVSYQEWNGTRMVARTLEGVRYNANSDLAEAEQDSFPEWNGSSLGGWYVVSHDVTIDDKVIVVGHVKLLLCDGATLTVRDGIEVAEQWDYSGHNKIEIPTSLTVYAQSGGTGKLIVNGYGLGECTSSKPRTVTIHGGSIETSGVKAPLYLYGGTVETAGEVVGTIAVTDGTLIAGGIEGDVTVTGGTVIANGKGIKKRDPGITGNIHNDKLTVGKGMVVYGDDTDQSTVDDDRKAVTLREPSDYATKSWSFMRIEPAPTTFGSYMDADGEIRECDAYTPIKDATTAWSSGWYAVNSNVTINNDVTVDGTADLILYDGVALTVNGEITGGALRIYGQHRGNGSLTVTGTDGTAIASGLTIHGGIISAKGGADGAGVDGAITVTRGKINATGSGTGAGISGASLIVNGGVVTASGGSGISSAVLTVNDGVVTATGSSGAGVGSNTVTVASGTLKATGAEQGISGTLNVTGEDRMVQGGANAASIAPILSPYNERKPYMVVGESVYTIFYKDAGDWQIPYCTYEYTNGSATEAMEQDGDFWRLTVHQKPTAVTFHEAQAAASQPETEQGGASSGGETSADETPVFAASTAKQAVAETDISARSDEPPTGKQIEGFGSFFVVGGGCRMVVFVDRENVTYVTVADGDVVEHPGYPEAPDGYYFNNWKYYEFKYGMYDLSVYDFGKTVKKSLTIYADYHKKNFLVCFMDESAVRRQHSPWLEIDQHVLYQGKATDPGTPQAVNPSCIFQGWLLSREIQYTDADGNTVTVPAGTKFDFDTPIECDVWLEASWKHVHIFDKPETFEHHKRRVDGWYEINDRFQVRMNNTGHYLACKYCDYEIMVPHTLDEHETCTECGTTLDHRRFFTVTYAVEDVYSHRDLESREWIEGYSANFPWNRGPGEGGLFVGYQVWDNTDPENRKLMRLEKNPWNTIFYVDRPLHIVATYRKRGEIYAKTSVKIATSKASDNVADLELSWSLPAGHAFLSAGILTTTNAELQKFNYSSWNKTKTVETGNLLKRFQNFGSYDDGLRESMRSRMLSGNSYTPGVDAIIHEFPVNAITRSGSYVVPHELPVGKVADSYGRWVYVMGYMSYVDTHGQSHTIYTKPVAISASNPVQSFEYTLHT